MEHEAWKLILSVVEDTWLQELNRSKTYYRLVNAGKMLTQLQVTCGGIHALDVLALQKYMQRYHLDSEGIPEYINEIKDAQSKAKRANNPITNKKTSSLR